MITCYALRCTWYSCFIFCYIVCICSISVALSVSISASLALVNIPLSPKLNLLLLLLILVVLLWLLLELLRLFHEHTQCLPYIFFIVCYLFIHKLFSPSFVISYFQNIFYVLLSLFIFIPFLK